MNSQIITIRFSECRTTLADKSGSKSSRPFCISAAIDITSIPGVTVLDFEDSLRAAATASLLGGISEPVSGALEIYKQYDSVKEKISRSIILRDQLVVPWLDVETNMLLGQNGHLTKEQITEFLSIAGLEGYEKYYPRQTVSGFNLRLALARGMASIPGFIVCDDIFCDMEIQLAEEMLQLLQKIAAEKSFVFILCLSNAGRYLSAMSMAKFSINRDGIIS